MRLAKALGAWFAVLAVSTFLGSGQYYTIVASLVAIGVGGACNVVREFIQKLIIAYLLVGCLSGFVSLRIFNIAWLLRRFPVFAIFGDGEFRIQPVYVKDVAELAVELAGKSENIITNALGPETFSYRGLVSLIRKRVKSRSKLVHVSPRTAYLLSKALNLITGDIIVTREEIYKLMADPLSATDRPKCPTSFYRWSQEYAVSLGVKYASELDRHYRIAPPVAI
ncbi:hypothetical protein LCGC14_3034600 [marine sediment metagenome]|uniref:NAD-dependent epimerase/dehydratase domain-containing protein n=1 Tax=marine sediment metagenome TaxID=412755 RepID=A0A0F8WRZ0_9ZZZZ